jgi:predicted CXXCH cytochrome family protein
MVLMGLLLWLAPSAHAQLISPGKLSRAHTYLEGIRNCTSCHSLGNQGIDNQKCLTCHTPLQRRIGAGQGFHASVSGQNCADCHKEHFGADFELVRLDERQFNHTRTGFQLTGAHRTVECRSCHQPEFIVAGDVRRFKGEHGTLNRTYLGLGTTCQTCHEADTPHAGQFEGEDCATCHATDAWEEASRFDHDKARFMLTGQHRRVDCASCHPQGTAGGETFMRFEGLSFANCSSCHQDAHNGAFGANCANCHNPAGWQQIRNFNEDRFDHAATGYTLEASHATLD